MLILNKCAKLCLRLLPLLQLSLLHRATKEKERRKTWPVTFNPTGNLKEKKNLKLLSYLSCVVDRIAEIYWCLRTPGFFANPCKRCLGLTVPTANKHWDTSTHTHCPLWHTSQLCSDGLICPLMLIMLVFTTQKIRHCRTGDKT